jgi:adenosylcobyric acid synthase
VVGLVPFFENIRIDSEDAVTVQPDVRPRNPIGPDTLNIAVIRLPAISNFTDMEILEREPDIVLNYLTRPDELSRYYDLLILPGTKNVMEDAAWLARSGWKKEIKRYSENAGNIFGICGGYQLLGRKIIDPHGVESQRKFIKGLDLMPIETSLETKKVVREVKGTCLVNHKRIHGYEIHMGRSTATDNKGRPYLRIHKPGSRDSWHDGWTVGDGRVTGTYVHGVFDSSGFKSEFLNVLRQSKGLRKRPVKHIRKSRLIQYDRLADHFEKYCDVKKIIKAVRGE